MAARRPVAIVGGVFLERELDTPLAKFAFVFTIFARGPAVLPEGGIEAIPAQVAEALPEESVAKGRRVERVDAPDVVLADLGVGAVTRS